MKCREIMEYLNKLAPETYAESWDNPGLLCGSENQEVRKVVIALDATDAAVAQAVDEDADLLLTHHPLIFKPLKRITDRDFIGRRLIKLINQNITYYAMHTNYDAAPGGMADAAAGRIGLRDTSVLQNLGEQDGRSFGIGRIGTLASPQSAEQMAELVKQRFGLPFVQVYGCGSGTLPVSRAAIVPGSGGSLIPEALAGGAKLMITGDISHHAGIDAAACGMAVIDAGHYGLEHIFIEHMEQYLRNEFQTDLELVKVRDAFPVQVI